MSASPTVNAANPAAPDIIEHLCRSERLMTAPELGSILSNQPKDAYKAATGPRSAPETCHASLGSSEELPLQHRPNSLVIWLRYTKSGGTRRT
jgi:hypothetical protein